MKTHTVTSFEYGMAERLAVIIESEIYPDGGHDKVAFMRGLGQIARSITSIPGRMGGAMQGLKTQAGSAAKGLGSSAQAAKTNFMSGYRPMVDPLASRAARGPAPRPVPGALESRAATPRGAATAGDAMNMPPAGAAAASAAAGAGSLPLPRGVNFRAPNAIDQVAAQRAANGTVPPAPAGAGGTGMDDFYKADTSELGQAFNNADTSAARSIGGPTMAAAAADGSKFPLLQRLRQTATENPLRFGAATGLAGAGAVGGIDAYGDHRRREALRQAGFGERLALALKLLSNPDSVANML